MVETLHHKKREIHLRLTPVEKGDLDNAAIRRRCLIVPVDVVATDHVEDQVDADAIGRILDRSDEILRAIVDGKVRAKITHGRAFVIGTGGREDLCAKGFGQLDGRGPDPGCTAVDKESLSGLQLSPLEDIVPHGEERLRDCRCLAHGETGGHRQGIGFVNHRIFGVAATGNKRRYRITRPVKMRTFPARFHDACYLETRNIRRTGRRGIGTLPLQAVGTVDPGCANLDENLPCRGDRLPALGQPQDIRSTRRGDFDGAHGPLSLFFNNPVARQGLGPQCLACNRSSRIPGKREPACSTTKNRPTPGYSRSGKTFPSYRPGNWKNESTSSRRKSSVFARQ